MKILWVVNIIFGAFCEEFGIKRKNVGGWISSMADQLERYKDTCELGLCFPIINEHYMKDGSLNGHKYYSFPFSQSDYRADVKDRFKEILADFQPDVIHIWGTEYPQALEMVNACKEMGGTDKVVLQIQGLISLLAKHYCEDIPTDYRYQKAAGYPSIEEERLDFVKRGGYEEEAIRKVKHVIGRTDWDKACTERLNANINYHFCREILRDAFYEAENTWNYETCEKHSIFVSQGHYPIKGLHYLLRAMPDILDVYPDTMLYIGGNSIFEADDAGQTGSYASYLKDLIEKNQLGSHLTCVGVIDEFRMIEMYQRCNVFVSPSSIENSPNSVCEAQLVGCPVVASYVGGVNSIWIHNDYSFEYQHNAEYMLAYYIKKIFNMRRFRPEKAARQMPKDICGDCMNIYKIILEGK